MFENKRLLINEVSACVRDPENKMILQRILHLLQDPETVDRFISGTMKAQNSTDNIDIREVLGALVGLALAADRYMERRHGNVPI